MGDYGCRTPVGLLDLGPYLFQIVYWRRIIDDQGDLRHTQFTRNFDGGARTLAGTGADV